MGEKVVLEEVSRDNLHHDLGLGEAEVPPCPLRMKLVLSRKPDDSGQEEKELEEDTPWRSKARLCACGNFEAPEGEDVTTQNVSPVGLRLMAHQLSKHKGWMGASGDVSLAFLNSALEAQEVVLLEPPAVLRRFNLVKPKILWRARKHMYGLRRSPKAWGNLREQTLHNQVLDTASGKIRVRLIPDQEGLFKLVCETTSKIVG